MTYCHFSYPPLDLLQGVGKDAVGVLRMIKRRLQAEMKTIGRNDLKMLSKLLQEDDLEVCSMLSSDHIFFDLLRLLLWRNGYYD